MSLFCIIYYVNLLYIYRTTHTLSHHVRSSSGWFSSGTRRSSAPPDPGSVLQVTRLRLPRRPTRQDKPCLRQHVVMQDGHHR